MTQETTSSRSHSGPRGRSRALRVTAFVVVIAVAATAVLAVTAPGWFRLTVLQPARDLLFFHREVMPLSDFAGIERQRPAPDETVVLDPGNAPEDITLVIDVWLPTAGRAPVALLLHGSSPRGRKLGFNMLLADRLRDEGWLVLTPDSRGYRRSRVRTDLRDPASWEVDGDLRRLVEWALQHPRGNGRLVGIGHSHGASLLIDVAFDMDAFTALALVGPSRERAVEGFPTRWQRQRFAGDRWLARPVPAEVMAERMRSYDIMRLAEVRTPASRHVPVLVMDGEREGTELIELLDEAAAAMPPPVTRVTVADSHHYCGAYQLPALRYPVFVRPDVFERCTGALLAFLADAVPAAPRAVAE